MSGLTEELLMSHVRVTDDGCWEWTGVLHSGGYGLIWTGPSGRRIQLKAHRAAWIVFRGRIPEGVSVLHRCDVPSCCNPDHLFLGTQADNMADMVRKGRSCRGEYQRSAKLTEHDVRVIRIARETFRTPVKRLAELAGVSAGTVRRVLNRQLWGHVQP